MGRRIRSIFDNKSFKPIANERDSHPGQLDIAEIIAVSALSPPIVSEIWKDPTLLTHQHLRFGLTSFKNEPLSRFRTIISWLATLNEQQIISWYRGVRGLGAGHVTSPVQMTPRSTLGDAETRRVLEVIGKEVGLFNIGPWTAEILLKFWELENLCPTVNDYERVCVLEPGRSFRETEIVTKTIQNILNQAYVLYIGVGPTWTPSPRSNLFVPKGKGFIRLSTLSHMYLWIDELAAIRSFIRAHGNKQPIVASSLGYDFGIADYMFGYGLLEGLPHVVMSMTDLRSLWMRIAWLQERGLAGSKFIEGQVLDSTRLKGYGYVVLKPRDNPSPVVVMPIVANKWTLIRKFATDIPNPNDVEVKPSNTPLLEWINQLPPQLRLGLTSAFLLTGRWLLGSEST